MDKLIIEARINEYATRKRNANVPWLPHEIARDARECHDAGASIVHFHGRDAEGGPDNRFETCRDTILAIRAQVPVLVHPSLGFTTVTSSFAERFAGIGRLAADPATRPDIAPIDMGSVNVDLCDGRSATPRLPGSVYVNPTEMLAEMAKALRGVGIKPSAVAWNVSFVRLIDAFARMGLLEPPLFVSLVLTEKIMLAGHPGTPAGLEAYRMFLPANVATVWAVTCIGGRLDGLLDAILLGGGHLQVGLGDYPYAEDGAPTNAAVVERIVRRARALGREPASPAEARNLLGMAAAPLG